MKRPNRKQNSPKKPAQTGGKTTGGVLLSGDERKPGGNGPELVKAPLMLMPMRLEYRLVSEQDNLNVLSPHPEAKRLMEMRENLSLTDPRDEKAMDAMSADIAELSAAISEAKPVIEPAKLQGERELWIRWYPDDNFAEAGIAPISEDEKTALQAVLDHPRVGDWPKVDDPGLVAVWSELVAMTGMARAVHLMRTQGQGGDPLWTSRIGRIPALPNRVAVFAMIQGDMIQLGEGAEISPNKDWGTGQVSYSPAALGTASWVSDFEAAVALGMGVKLRDPSAIKQAFEASWLVCVGLSDESGTETITQWLADRVAGGGISYLPQDTPTNNTPNALAGPDDGESAYAKLSPHTRWELGLLQKERLGASLLADALGIEESAAMQARGADEDGHAEAAAMIRVIGPALVDGALAATSTMNDVTDTSFIELLAQHVHVRGLLPSLKVGNGAYGVQPVTDSLVSPAGNYELTSAEEAYQEFIRQYAEGVKTLLMRASDGVTLRIEPDDPDASEKLTDILQTSRVSRRLDVADEGEHEVSGLGCPYVEGVGDDHKPSAYLRDLGEERLDDLPEPDENDTTWPLLYRLAHLSAMRNRVLEVVKGTTRFVGRGNLRQVQGGWKSGLSPSQRAAVNTSLSHSVASFRQASNQTLHTIPSAILPQLRSVNARFGDALLTLRGVAARNDGAAELETLMMEVVDLFQHRLDAWITGLASIRLKHLRDDHPEAGLKLGWYGMLGKLRETSATGGSDGYIQAPGQAQAVSAAILRSAYLRNRAEGAFEIDLSARRTRSALKLMDHIRHGVPLPEALGLRGERFLRDRGKTPVTYELREKFPLENVDADGKGKRGPIGRRCFDGLALVEATGELTPEQRDVKIRLANDLDALSDVVVAEAVHARAGGSAEVAAAWLRVLSGGPIPHRPEFLRTRRSGHASDYRVSLLLPQTAPAKMGPPLAMAEYGLATMINQAVPRLEEILATASLIRDGEVLHKVSVSIGKHLELDGVHLGKLGVDALRRRIEAYAIAHYVANTRVEVMYKQGWMPDRPGFVAAGIVIETELGKAAEATEKAAGLWRMAHAGQPLSPGDLSNAADPAHPLDETQHSSALMGAAVDMWARAERLETALRVERRKYASLLKRMFLAIAERYEKPGSAWGESRSNDRRLRLQVVKLHRSLAALERWSVNGAGQRPAPERLTEDMVGWETALRQNLSALDARLRDLSKARKGRAGSAATLSEARAELNASMAAVRLITGVETLALFPVFGKSAPLSPLLEAQQAASDALGPWPQYRARLAGLLEEVGQSHSGYAVSAGATADDADDELSDTRDESLAPRAYHRGIFLSKTDDLGAATISGLVVDEWVEKRPSTQQDAAIAINYDTPQAEAPNALVLAVPEDPFAPRWDTSHAAAMVGEMIDLLRIRALTTQSTPLTDTILPLSNLVAHVGSGANERPRIPEAKFKSVLHEWFSAPGVHNVVDVSNLHTMGENWNQTNRFGRNRKQGS
ncbi:hypothetical protein [Ruegeria hyattellae]|uniref:hypothetical protein n=1 Tax=Ruegeria hyattellae TaxID=3233337 RepID=UPI00355BDF5B